MFPLHLANKCVLPSYLITKLDDNNLTCQYQLAHGKIDRYVIDKIIDEGAFGSVYRVHTYVSKELKYYAAKFVPLYTKPNILCSSMSLKRFEDEVKYTIEMSKLGLSPKFIESFVIDSKLVNDIKEVPEKYHSLIQRGGYYIKIGVIISELWDMALYMYKYKYPIKYSENKDLIEKLFTKMVDKYLDNKMVHHDMHSANIMLKLDKDNNVLDMISIDFANVRPINSKDEIDKARITMYDNIKK